MKNYMIGTNLRTIHGSNLSIISTPPPSVSSLPPGWRKFREQVWHTQREFRDGGFSTMDIFFIYGFLDTCMGYFYVPGVLGIFLDTT